MIGDCEVSVLQLVFGTQLAVAFRLTVASQLLLILPSRPDRESNPMVLVSLSVRASRVLTLLHL